MHLFLVSRTPREVSAYFAFNEHEHRWQREMLVRLYFHQGEIYDRE